MQLEAVGFGQKNRVSLQEFKLAISVVGKYSVDGDVSGSSLAILLPGGCWRGKCGICVKMIGKTRVFFLEEVPNEENEEVKVS